MKRNHLFFLLSSVLLLSCASKQTPMTKEIIATDKAPAAIGPYSQAVLANGTLYCSGQIAINPETGELVSSGVADETRQVMANIGAVLKAAGMDYSNVVKASIFMASMGDYQAVNEVYSEYFTQNPPAREAVEVAGLPKNVNVEISVTAVK